MFGKNRSAAQLRTHSLHYFDSGLAIFEEFNAKEFLPVVQANIKKRFRADRQEAIVKADH